MQSCKLNIKNHAILRNITGHAPVTFNKTRWSCVYEMLKRFIRMLDGIITVLKKRKRIGINSSYALKEQAKFLKMLLYVSTYQLQNKTYQSQVCNNADVPLIP